MKQAQVVAGTLADDIDNLDDGVIKVNQADFELLQTEHRQLQEELESKEILLQELNDASVKLVVSKEQGLKSMQGDMHRINAEKEKFQLKAETLAAELLVIKEDYEKIQFKYEQVKHESSLLGEKVKIMEDSLHDQKIDAGELTTALQIEVDNRVNSLHWFSNDYAVWANMKNYMG